MPTMEAGQPTVLDQSGRGDHRLRGGCPVHRQEEPSSPTGGRGRARKKTTATDPTPLTSCQDSRMYTSVETGKAAGKVSETPYQIRESATESRPMFLIYILES